MPCLSEVVHQVTAKSRYFPCESESKVAFHLSMGVAAKLQLLFVLIEAVNMDYYGFKPFFFLLFVFDLWNMHSTSKSPQVHMAPTLM